MYRESATASGRRPRSFSAAQECGKKEGIKTTQTQANSLFPIVYNYWLAEGEGFEAPARFPVQWFSRPPPSTTRPSLRLVLAPFYSETHAASARRSPSRARSRFL